MHHTAPPGPAALRKRRPPAGAVPCAALRRYMLHRVIRCNALPEAGAGPAPGRKICRGAVGSRTPLHRGVSSSSQTPAGDPPPCCRRPENICRSMFRCGGLPSQATRSTCPQNETLSRGCSRIERGWGASIAPDPAGLITLECWPGKRGRRSFVAVAARTNKCSSAVKARSRGTERHGKP